MGNTSISLENVNMKFRISTEKVDSLKEYFFKKIKKKIHYNDFYALNNISFKLSSGERVGVIGHNGAGKSTLLKIMSGVLKPTEGTVSVNGSVAPLLELGAGFDPELSGADNIFLNGAILGKSKEYLEQKYDEIVEYSELGDFIYTPVKNYSSGMRARLGFSIATQVEPDILIVDEVLSVGDQKFRKKSSAKMMELMNSGKTVVFVSHNLEQIRKLTNQVIWLHKGMIKEIGNTKFICDRYQSYIE